MHLPYSRFSVVALAAASLLTFAPLANAASVSIMNIEPTSGISAGTAVTFYASAYGFSNPTYAVSDSTGTDGSIDKNGYFTWTPTVDDAGTHTFTVTVTDAFGASASSTANIYVVPDTISLENLLPGTTAYAHEPVTFSVHAPGFVTPTYLVSDTYAGTTVTESDIDGNGNFSWTPALNEQGSHKLTITVRDAYGRFATLAETITVLPPALAIENLSPGTAVAVGTPVAFSASSTGLTSPTYALTDSLGWYSTVKASDTSTSTGAFSWTPAASDIGTHVLTLTATDANGGTASAHVTITVGTTAPALATNAAPATGNAAPAAGAAPSTTVATNGYVFTAYLGTGSRGTAVTELQKRLTALGAYSGPVTGYFGPMTEAGVQDFQRTHGIVSSGTPWTTGYGAVGPKTRTALNAS